MENSSATTCRDDATKVSDNPRDQDESVAHRRPIEFEMYRGMERKVSDDYDVMRDKPRVHVCICGIQCGIQVCNRVIESWAKIQR